jgi:hypothetical protein
LHHNAPSWDQLLIAYRHQTGSQLKLPHGLKVFLSLTNDFLHFVTPESPMHFSAEQG